MKTTPLSFYLKNYWWVLLGFFFLSLSMYFPFAKGELKDCQHLFQKGAAFAHRGNFEDSLYSLRVLYASFPLCPLAPKALLISGGLYAAQLHKTEKAAQLFHKLLERYPHSKEAEEANLLLRNLKGRVLKKWLRGYPSLEPLTQSIELRACSDRRETLRLGKAYLSSLFYDRKNPEVIFLKAIGAKCRREKKRARQMLKKLYSTPLSSLSRLELADMAYQDHAYREGLEILSAGSSDLTSFFYLGRGDFLQALGKPKEALSMYEKSEGTYRLEPPYFSRIHPLLQEAKIFYLIGEKKRGDQAAQQFFAAFPFSYRRTNELGEPPPFNPPTILASFNRNIYLTAEELVRKDHWPEGWQLLQHLLLPENKRSSRASQKTNSYTLQGLTLALRLLVAQGKTEQAQALFQRLSSLSIPPTTLRIHRALLSPLTEKEIPRAKRALLESPLGFIVFYKLAAFKETSAGTSLPPFAYNRIEVDLAKRYADHLLSSLTKTDMPDLDPAIVRFDLFFRQSRFEEAAQALPGRESQAAAFTFSLLKTLTPKPSSATQAAALLREIQITQKNLALHDANALQYLLHYLRLIHREDLLPIKLAAYAQKYPQEAQRAYLQLLAEVLAPWKQKMENRWTMCLGKKEKEELNLTTTALALYRAKRLPARREQLSAILQLPIFPYTWNSVIQGYLFPKPPFNLQAAHEALFGSFSEWLEKINRWQNFCEGKEQTPPLRPSGLPLLQLEIGDAFQKMLQQEKNIAETPF